MPWLTITVGNTPIQNIAAVKKAKKSEKKTKAEKNKKQTKNKELSSFSYNYNTFNLTLQIANKVLIKRRLTDISQRKGKY